MVGFVVTNKVKEVAALIYIITVTSNYNLMIVLIKLIFLYKVIDNIIFTLI